MRGIALKNMGKNKEALKSFEKTKELDPINKIVFSELKNIIKNI